MFVFVLFCCSSDFQCLLYQVLHLTFQSSQQVAHRKLMLEHTQIADLMAKQTPLGAPPLGTTDGGGSPMHSPMQNKRKSTLGLTISGGAGGGNGLQRGRSASKVRGERGLCV